MGPKEMQPAGSEPNVPLETGELSEREREILVLVAEGASNKEVAQKLIISPNTVKVHLRNIFGKIGVSSRTEAALYAVRAGLVRVAVEPGPNVEAEAGNGAVAEAVAEAEQPVIVLSAPPAPAPARPARSARPRWLAAGAALVVLAIVVAAVVVPRLLQGATPTPTTPAATAIPRWQARTAMRAARTRLATVTYENLVYAIGGETDAGVSDQNERYDPERDTWASLAPKPVAVVDIGAAVVGGLIYVPGGRVASGGVTDVVEAYDPVRDEWAMRAPLPVALSGYALAAFEGRLYVFGGWNGTDFVANVFEYEPASDTWIERTRMPTARGFAAAARAGDKLYVIGGTDAQGASRAVEAYVPARDSEVANPWETLPDAPAGQHLTAAASIADALYVAGRDEDSGDFAAWEFRPEGEAWQPLELGSGFAADWLGMVAVRTHIFVFGAPQIPGAAVQLMAYQALYTNLIPVITSGEGEP